MFLRIGTIDILPYLIARSIASRNKLIAISLKTGQARLTIRVLVAITLAHAVRVCAQIILQINYVLFIDAIIIILFTLSEHPGTLSNLSLWKHLRPASQSESLSQSPSHIP
ncbi:unnamed protein product [Bathycoccus prasinos]